MLLDTYWKRNWAVQVFAENLFVKEVDGKKWVLNPISKFYYSLRSEKDRFSTINQSSSVYVFDLFRMFIMEQNKLINFEYHDEVLMNIKPDEKDKIKIILDNAIKKVNDTLKLNVTVGYSFDTGFRYSECH